MKITGMIGQKFGRLTVLERDTSKDFGRVVWVCKCDCGNTTSTPGRCLRDGKSQSCGCWQRKRASEHNTTHGRSKFRPFDIWRGMIRRCEDPKHKPFKHYGGRGISVCDRWMNSFEDFWEDMQHGYSDKLQIDRKDNDGDYEPGNCHWVTTKVQAKNKRCSTILEFNGQRKNASEWSEELGFGTWIICRRIKAGWSTEKILTTPNRRAKN